MAVYSNSKLSTFEQCRQKYKFHYLDRIKVPGESVEAFLGSRVHEALEKLYEDVRHRKIPEVDEVLAYYRERWEAEWSDEVKIVNARYTGKNYFDMGEDFIRDYCKRHHPFDEGRTLGLETQDMLDLGDGNRFHIRIDRLTDEGDGVYSVNDYKTSKSLPKQEYLDADRQLAAYSIWVRLNYPDVRRVRLVWHYLAHDRHMESERTPEQLEALKESIRKTIGRIEKCDTFDPTTSALCSWCEYKEICPSWKHEAALSGMTEEEFEKDDGVRLVNRLAELTEQERELSGEIARAKEDLIEYAGQFGLEAVAGSEMKAKVSRTETLPVPKKGTPERERLEENLRKLGVYDDLLTLDAFAVKKLDDATIEKLGLEKEERFNVRLFKGKN